MASASGTSWTPHSSLTQAPTNLKEAIDWVLRVTGRDGRKNEKAAQPPQFGCLCYLAKAVKDLLYDARSPGTPGPSPMRNWDAILLDQERDIVQPVLQDLGLLSAGSSTDSATSTTYTCAGGTEVIKALIDQLALGLQKWVGWQEGDSDKCCLKGDKGIGRKCECSTGVGVPQCCSPGVGSSTTCHQCSQCGTKATSGTDKKCYLSAYCKATTQASGGGASTEGKYYWPTISGDSTKVHLLARIFLGSVCLIWSGLSQLGFLTGGNSGNDRWSQDGTLSKETDGLGSFMAAMGYDLDRLNGSGGQGSGKKGSEVFGMLKGGIKDLGNGATEKSVAEYYSSIYGNAKTAAGKSTTESICKDYPLLVLHILASGYFRAGSAGAKNIIPAPKAQQKTDDDASKKPRHPRTIREILYWLSALPYSEKYRELVERMEGKMKGILPKEMQKKQANEQKLTLESTESGKNTDLKRQDITHYILAACGYCPLVLIGIQGTIEREVTSGGAGGNSNDNQGGSPNQNNSQSGSNSNANKDKRCPEHKKDPKSKRCTLDEVKKQQEAAKAQASQTLSPQQPSATTTGKPLEEGQVCYGGYHLAVKDFGPLHGMYANGLFGFDLGGSAAQCLDQLRIYVYHCFYQLYFLRKQCGVGVESGAVLGWQSCRYGKGVSGNSGKDWRCTASGTGSNDKCKCKESAGHSSPLMAFLCDGPGPLVCGVTVAKGVDKYPEIIDHMEAKEGIAPPHFGKPPKHCPVPMGWQSEASTTGSSNKSVNHFKDLNTGSHKTATLSSPPGNYPAHCTGNTLSHLLEYYCDPEKCPSGTLVVLLRLLACITPTVPRTLGDLFGFYYYIVYIGGRVSWNYDSKGVKGSLKKTLEDAGLGMIGTYNTEGIIGAITTWSKDGNSGTGCSSSCKKDTLKCLYGNSNHCTPFLSPLSGQQYGQLSPLMAGTYLSWLVYLIEGFQEGLQSLVTEYKNIQCKDDCKGAAGAAGCGGSGQCQKGSHGDPCPSGGVSGGANQGVCQCTSVVSCTGVLPVLYKYGFGYGDVKALHSNGGVGTQKKCHQFLTTLNKVEGSTEFSQLTNSINQLIYTTRLPWIFVLAVAWLVAVLYLAFGAIWPLDWTHMRSHCRGWFRKGSLSPWEVLMVGKKKGRGILEFFGKT